MMFEMCVSELIGYVNIIKLNFVWYKITLVRNTPFCVVPVFNSFNHFLIFGLDTLAPGIATLQ